MVDKTEHTGTQGGTHMQHVEAGKHSHDNTPKKEEDSKSTSHSTAHGHTPSKEGAKHNSHSDKK